MVDITSGKGDIAHQTSTNGHSNEHQDAAVTQSESNEEEFRVKFNDRFDVITQGEETKHDAGIESYRWIKVQTTTTTESGVSDTNREMQHEQDETGENQRWNKTKGRYFCTRNELILRIDLCIFASMKETIGHRWGCAVVVNTNPNAS